MPSFRRRQFLLTAGVAVGAALLKGCSLNPPSPNSMSALADVLPPSPATMPEVPGIKLGYIAIAESAPLIIAQLNSRHFWHRRRTGWQDLSKGRH